MQKTKDLGLADLAWRLSLNNDHGFETSLLEVASRSELVGNAFYFCGIDLGATALLIALDRSRRRTTPGSDGSSSGTTRSCISIMSSLQMQGADRARPEALGKSLCQDPAS